jgi:CRISPR-associated RAMP protein (TIGR02581 family)
MLKKFINECTVELKLHAVDPILVKSGLATVSGADMAFVLTYRGGHGEPYLPGSSLKGVLRSHAERIARSLSSPSACEPFWNDDIKEEIRRNPSRAETMWCSEKFKVREKQFAEEIDNATAYKDSCPACRFFGSTYYVGRFAVSDAYLVPGSRNRRPQQRDGVGIDRYTGGASKGAKFNLEVLTDVTFKCMLKIRNFEVWQLGWLAYVIQDLKDEIIHVGSGKSRGLGRVKGEVESVTVSYIVSSANELSDENGHARLRGIGSLMLDASYGLESDDETLLPEGHMFTRPSGKLRHECRFENGRDTDLWIACAPKWDDFICSYNVPAEMSHTRLINRAGEEAADE